MIRIQLLNKISPIGLELLPRPEYEVGEGAADPDGILVRSQSMLDMELPGSLLAVARAGAGVNTIPVERCSGRGIVVFNTPGANANGVKELVIMALIMASRRVHEAICWARSLDGMGEEVPKLIEKGKSSFQGTEIKGKRLGVIGLGAIGVMVANDAECLGMEVSGFDPFISVESAWGLSRNVKKALSLDGLLRESDYITLHVPLNGTTRGMLGKELFAIMKKGARLLNFARGELVRSDDLKDAMQLGIVAVYVTDFPDAGLVGREGVIPVPHLGASTAESEDNCAVMAARQLREFFEKGNITNSVNLPDCVLPKSGKTRLTVINRNIPNIIGQITPVLAGQNLNIANMLNKSRGDYACTIIDLDSDITAGLTEKIRAIEGVLRVRVIH